LFFQGNYHIFNVFGCFEALSQLYEERLLATSCLSVRLSAGPSVRTEQLDSHRTDYHEILYLDIFRKSVEKIQVSLISDKNKWYFTWRPTYIFYHISLTSA